MATRAAAAGRIEAPHPSHKRVTILGATGSIGSSTLKVIAEHRDRYAIDTLTAMDNAEKLAELARAFKPRCVVIGNEAHYDVLKEVLSGTGIEVQAGEQAVIEAAAQPVDIVIAAIVGAAGLKPTLAAIRRGGCVALANKECLVVAGEIMMREAREHGATLLPVDSEHSAVFQVFDRKQAEHVRRVTLTASGGPFRDWSIEKMREATPSQAVKHPNWSMGAKISVDSATLMNKGLELIEAYHLFPLQPDQLGVIVHPESIVHCLVEYVDGSTLAQLSSPDMCTPIACALAWPERISAPVPQLDLVQQGVLHFEAPDEGRFPALPLAVEAMKNGQEATAILNAANEVAVQAFLEGKLKFLDIVTTVRRTLDKVNARPATTLDDVLQLDREARRVASGFIF